VLLLTQQLFNSSSDQKSFYPQLFLQYVHIYMCITCVCHKVWWNIPRCWHHKCHCLCMTYTEALSHWHLLPLCCPELLPTYLWWPTFFLSLFLFWGLRTQLNHLWPKRLFQTVAHPFMTEDTLMHQEITRVILCRLILNDIIIHMNFFNDIIMFYKIVWHFYVINFRDYVV